jgi:hypothetical protein
MPAKKTSKAAPKSKTKVRGAAWLPDGKLAVLANRDKVPTVLVLDGDKVVGERAAVAKAVFIIALPSGAVVTVASSGACTIATATGTRKAGFGSYTERVTVAHGIAYAECMTSIFRLDEPTGKWTEIEIGDAIGVEAIGEGEKTAVVALEGDDDTIIADLAGDALRERTRVDGPVNGFAYLAERKTLYACGRRIQAIDGQQKVTRLASLADEDTIMACAASAGALVGATLFEVVQYDATGKPTVLLPPGDGEEIERGNAFAASGDRIAYARSGKLYVARRGDFRHIAL